jgi:transcriptional repressor NrdR
LFPHSFYGFPLALSIAVCQYMDMFCINCFHPSTSVVNSRSKKNQAAVWRRRHCSHCGTTFTTIEQPSLTNNMEVHTSSGDRQSFNLGRLILSISRAFTHSQEIAKTHSLALAQTIEQLLSTQVKQLTTEEIAATTHTVLKRFDELAALQYAAQHDLIVSVRKRGRPSTSWRGQPKHGSPSL